MTPWHHVPGHTRGWMLAYELLSDCTDTFEWEGGFSPAGISSGTAVVLCGAVSSAVIVSNFASPCGAPGLALGTAGLTVNGSITELPLEKIAHVAIRRRGEA